jgi:hypothetical protein
VTTLVAIGESALTRPAASSMSAPVARRARMTADEPAFRRAVVAVLARGWEALEGLQVEDDDVRDVRAQVLRLELLLLDDARRRLERDATLSRRQSLDLADAIDLLRSGVPESVLAGNAQEQASRVQNAIYERILGIDASDCLRTVTG